MIMIIASRSSNWRIFQLIFVICGCFLALSNAVPLRGHSIPRDNGRAKRSLLQADGLVPKETMYLYKSAEFGEGPNDNENTDDYYSISDGRYSNVDVSEKAVEPALLRMAEDQPSDNTNNSTERDAVEDLVASAINVNCSSAPKRNQRLSSSFVDLSSRRGMDGQQDDETEAKIMRSVHGGEDVTLCWIETTIIKENTSMVPPARLVMREYTISFENSATIPNPYLECSRLPGEIEPGTGIDKDLGKNGLFEIIDEDTKKSRIVNFTVVDHEDEIVIWKHKRVQCGVGSLVTKSILEWSSENGQNPKKRVEIKVGPKFYAGGARPQPSTTTARPALKSSNSFDFSVVPSLTTEKSLNDDLSPIIRSTAETIIDTTTDATAAIDTNTETSTTVTACCNTESTEDAESTGPTEQTEPTEFTVLPTTTETSEKVCTDEETCEKSSESVSNTEPSTYNRKVTLNGSDESCSATSSEYCETSDEVMLEDGISFQINDTLTTEDNPQPDDQIAMHSTTPSTVPSTDYELGFVSEDDSVSTTTEGSVQSTVVITEGTTLENDMNSSPPGLTESCTDGICHTTTDINNVEDQTLSTTVFTEAVDSEETEINVLIRGSIPTTVERRLSTIPTPQTGATITDGSSDHANVTVDAEAKHRLALKIKVTLEHITEGMEKQNLIEIEKKLFLHEDPNEHENSTILNQVQALNDSISFQKLQTLFNCSTLEKLNKRISKWAMEHYSTPLPEDQLATTSASGLLNETSSQRRKRRTLDSNLYEDLRRGIDRLLDSSLEQKGRKSLSDAEEEKQNRLGDNYHVLRRWTRETLAKSSDGSAGLNTLTEFSFYAAP